MCNKCDEIEWKVKQYRMALSDATDPLAITLLRIVIADLRSEKQALHPSQQT